MYSLKEAWTRMLGSEPISDWDGKLYCTETNREITFRTNETRGFIAAYTFTLVTRGWLTIDTASFSKFFARLRGLSPREYRNQRPTSSIL